jgi:KipI family sensor histidine kinase inhibitor
MDGQGELFDLQRPRIASAGDTALTIELGDAGAPGVSGRVLDLYLRFKDAELPGVLDLVPAIRSLTVHYDPAATSARMLRSLVEAWVLAVGGGHGDFDERPAGRVWRIPACYAAEAAPDVDDVARRCGLMPWQVSALHACVSYRVLMVGFLPGQPYLGDLPPPLRLPRRETPRIDVPAGSVAIAGTMCVIYPFESPGGWHIIGRTPARLFDQERAEPALLAPGDEVRFRAVEADELEALSEAVRAGRWVLEPEICDG